MGKYYTEEISINGQFTLSGTITIPNEFDKKVPGILFLSGSGPIDRNANMPKGKLKLNLYRDLADYMTELGFITLRYDKRGVGLSEGKYFRTGFIDLVDDAERALDCLKNHPLVDENQIIVCGHSEGCIIGAKLSSRHQFQGLMLLSGAVDSLESALKLQRQNAYEELMSSKGFKGWLFRKLKIDQKGEKSALKLFKKMRETDKDVIRVQLFIKQNAKWFREHFNYDPVNDLKNVSCPVLGINGDKDPQVNANKVKDLHNLVNGEVETYIIPNMEHGLKEKLGKKSILNVKKDFKKFSDKPIKPEVQNIIKTWLQKHYK